MEGTQFSSVLRFYLNGQRVVLDGDSVDPDTTLLTYLRGIGLTGTKLGCGEGGCGACTVVLQSRNPATGKIEHRAINACLAPLVSVDGRHVITIEALGNSENPHPLQERMWKLSGSQCGFCTPGIVMNVYALLREAAYRGALTVEDIELEGALDGNLCRCTGYAPIFAAVKSFVGSYLSKVSPTANGDSGRDAEVELPFNYEAAGLLSEKPAAAQCCTHDQPVNGAHESAPAAGKGCGRSDCCQLNGGLNGTAESAAPKRAFPLFEFKPYRPGTELIFPPALMTHKLEPLKFGSKSRLWYRPTTLDQLLALKKAFPDAKLVGGSSEIAIEVGILGRKYPTCIFVGDVPELQSVSPVVSGSDSPNLTFGANLPLSDLEELCKTLSKELPSNQSGPVKAIRDQLRYFAGRQVRNAASVGGNIATASPISDLNPVWIATGAKVVAASAAQGEFELPVDTFFVGYRKTQLPSDAVIVRVVVPLNGSPEREYVRAFKQAKRKDDDISIVCSCMFLRLGSDNAITAVRLAFGGMAAITVQAPKTEAFLLGKPLTSETVEGAIDVLSGEFDLPHDVPGGMASYRRTLAMSFLFRFFASAAEQFGIQFGSMGANVDGDLTDSIHRNISSSSRDNSDPYALATLGQQIPHSSGLKHVTGEAVYVDDMPTVGNEAYLALVLSDRAHAKIVSVDPSAALAEDGVISYVDHRDLASPKANIWGPSATAMDETFFAVDEVIAHGQIIGAIVAKTKIIAVKAARLVKVQYEDLPYILTIEEAIEARSFFPQYDRRIARGDEIEEALARCDHVVEGSTRTGGQEHFYLETNACLVVPKLEGGEMEVFSSTQALNDTQKWVAQVTGVPRNRIVARGKRLGGGFGGKESRTAMLAAVCAVAAKKLRRPIRSMMDRDVDIRTTGQRHPVLAEWKVGFTKEGKLQALQCTTYVNGGYSIDLSIGVCDRALAHLDNTYYIPHFDARGKICRTNTVSNTAFRGFGGPQGMFIAESYIEKIAHTLKMDVDRVREINLYTEGQRTPFHQQVLDWHIPRMIKECAAESDYVRRKAEVAAFNKTHRWRKRGICLVPTKFGLAFGIKFLNQAGALVHIYTDGSVLVAHGGTEMGQGLYTKCTQIAAQELGVPHDSVFTSESSTNTVPNTVPTAASAGSDLNGYAVYNACKELNERLKPYREKLGPDASMAALASAAFMDRVNLSATGFWGPPELGYVWRSYDEGGGRDDEGKVGPLFMYFTQGVAASEVEVDILTGDHTVLRTDIKMDVGKSLNPAIDYGQIEGAFVQGMGWSTIEESLWLKNGAIFTAGPGTYKIPGFADTPQQFHVRLLKGVEWPNLKSIRSSKGIGEPPLFLGCSVAIAIRDALRSARADAGIDDVQDFRLPLTSERIRLAAGDFLAQKGKVEAKEGQKGWFVPF
ncbi:putative xanthine dehydrogenase HxA [Hyaloraphidium curvatum]|nr:putative xanthine dehydrogenase HxA [Hyaloraphidium curvatum]